MKTSIRKILENLKEGIITVDQAYLALKKKPFEDLDYAKIDFHREIRKGTNEVIFGAGKTATQLLGIIEIMVENSENPVLITKLSSEKAEIIKKQFDINYFNEAQIGVIGKIPEPDGIGNIVVVTAGTSDIPIAEEAAITAEVFANNIIRLYDVGVAGLNRLLSNLDVLMNAQVIISVAGMEGALTSVVGGLVDCPVISVPTSVGYGANFGGITALLSMLNSCSSGVSIVNIDNGFGAGYLASMINHIDRRKQ